MSVRVLSTELFVLNMRTRMPFKYGIATLTALPHLIVRAECEIGGKRQRGFAADGFPPKWFTKNPDTSFAQDLAEMLEVIRNACAVAQQCGPARSVFAWWRAVYEMQGRWGGERGFPPLLWNFGVSLVERAVIDAFCRAREVTFAAALRENTFGMELGELHGELAGMQAREFLPARPLERVIVRHTVGLADPLTDADVASEEKIDDGLPQTLEESIRAYGLTHFKIKFAGNVEKDLERLRRIAAVLDRQAGAYAFTLDGNENYHAVGPFRELWERLGAERGLRAFMGQLIFVEQPLHRSVALSEESRKELLSWRDRPAMIIDESDATLADLPAALAGGYAGTSHKNCKGVFKGVANACLIAQRSRADISRTFVMSAEDLANVGPVALLEDLAVAAALGISHAERNGHHYFRGLSAFPEAVQEQMLGSHGDLYRRHDSGFATLRIANGSIDVSSVNAAPFGLNVEPDLSAATKLEHWRAQSLGL